MTVFNKQNFKELGIAVRNGMPETEAEKIIDAQRKQGATGEEAYWLELIKDSLHTKTTIALSNYMRDKLSEIKEPGESYEDVIKKLIMMYEVLSEEEEQKEVTK